MIDLPICLLELLGVPAAAWILGGNPLRWPIMIVFAVIGISGGLALIAIGIGMARAIRAESKAGYTTLFDPRKKHLWQLDPQTGAAISKPL